MYGIIYAKLHFACYHINPDVYIIHTKHIILVLNSYIGTRMRALVYVKYEINHFSVHCYLDIAQSQKGSLMRTTDITGQEKKEEAICFFICFTAKPFISVSFRCFVISEDYFASLIQRNETLVLPWRSLALGRKKRFGVSFVRT